MAKILGSAFAAGAVVALLVSFALPSSAIEPGPFEAVCSDELVVNANPGGLPVLWGPNADLAVSITDVAAGTGTISIEDTTTSGGVIPVAGTIDLTTGGISASGSGSYGTLPTVALFFGTLTFDGSGPQTLDGLYIVGGDGSLPGGESIDYDLVNCDFTTSTPPPSPLPTDTFTPTAQPTDTAVPTDTPLPPPTDTPTPSATATSTATATPPPPGTAPGTITIVKDARPNSFQDFTFTTSFTPPFMLDDDPRSDDLPKERSFTLPPGRYVVRESEVAGWSLLDIFCRPRVRQSEVDIDFGNETVTVDLAPGEHVRCVFVNFREEGDCLVTVRLLSVSSSGPDIGSEWRLRYKGDGPGAEDQFDLNLPSGATHTFDPPREISWIAKGRAGKAVNVLVSAQATELDAVNDVGHIDSFNDHLLCDSRTEPFTLRSHVFETPWFPFFGMRTSTNITFEFELVLQD